MSFKDGYWWSNDEIRLHYRLYSNESTAKKDALPVLCLHGLTRNARDFHNLAEWLQEGRDVLVPDMRGRGESGFAKDPMTYMPLYYIQDIERLLDEMGWQQFILIGTSMGGLLSMMLTSLDASRVAGVVINDIGPELNETGFERILAPSGRSMAHDTWMHAARHLMALHGHIHPEWALKDWIAQAKRTHRLTESGKIVVDYDARIFEPLAAQGAQEGLDLWSVWRSLKNVPMTLIRGALSDLLTEKDAKLALKELDVAKLVTIPKVGHAPTLDEAKSRKAIQELIERAETSA